MEFSKKAPIRVFLMWLGVKFTDKNRIPAVCLWNAFRSWLANKILSLISQNNFTQKFKLANEVA